MADTFRVALSGDFRKADGSPTFPDFDLAPLRSAPGVEMVFLEPAQPDPRRPARGFRRADPARPSLCRDSVPKSGRLAVVARFGVGYDTVDVEACTRGRHRARHHAGRRAPPGRRLDHHADAGADRQADDQGPADARGRGRLRQALATTWASGLVGRTLGSLGIGNIGAELFRLAKPFDMKFIAHDPYADKKVAAELGIELVEPGGRFPPRPMSCRVSVPADAETRHIVNAERLALMKPTAYLINTARGPIVDQKALTKALQERRIAGAGLDVLEQEPPDADDPILKLDNVILAPHALCWTDQCFAGNGAADVSAVLDVQHGREPRVVVNRAVLETETWKNRLAAFRERFAL